MTRGTGTAPRRGRTCQGLLGGHDPNGVCQEFEVAEHALERVLSQFATMRSDQARWAGPMRHAAPTSSR
jgi:hypothetical protein